MADTQFKRLLCAAIDIWCDLWVIEVGSVAFRPQRMMQQYLIVIYANSASLFCQWVNLWTETQ